MSEYRICPSCKLAIQPGRKVTVHNGEVKHAECGKHDRQANSLRYTQEAYQRNAAAREVARVREVVQEEEARTERTAPFPTRALQLDRKAIDDYAAAVGCSPREALRQIRNKRKKEYLLNVIATGDETDLRRVVASLVRSMYA